MEFIVFLIIGLIVGVVARLLMPGPDPIGILGTIAIGCIGALIGGVLWTEVFGPDNDGVAWIGSVLVAMGLLFLYRRMTLGRGTSSRTVV
ncbi:MAG: GlsB/YeaQ/YmgE family stress response membrane protein [Actinomycetota bacterium]|nr:GlsB/YeaQ/YmgE family stress response membrane protein [Actinomycetota bacterium]